MAIKEMYDRFKREIESETKIKVGKLTLDDDNGVVSIKVIPKLNPINMQFTDVGELPGDQSPDPDPETDPEEDEDDIVIIPNDEDDGFIIGWGTTGDNSDHGFVAFSLTDTAYRLYRSKDGGDFKKIDESNTRHFTDSPLPKGTYRYYIVPVTNGKEGVASKVVKATL